MPQQRKRVKNYNKYADDFKRKIAKSYLKGEASYGILAEENGLRDKTVVKEFVKWYRGKLSSEPNFEEQYKEKKLPPNLSKEELTAQIKRLEKELKHAELKTEMLETMIDVAEAELKIEIRKKSDTNQ